MRTLDIKLSLDRFFIVKVEGAKSLLGILFMKWTVRKLSFYINIYVKDPNTSQLSMS